MTKAATEATYQHTATEPCPPAWRDRPVELDDPLDLIASYRFKLESAQMALDAAQHDVKRIEAQIAFWTARAEQMAAR